MAKIEKKHSEARGYVGIDKKNDWSKMFKSIKLVCHENRLLLLLLSHEVVFFIFFQIAARTFRLTLLFLVHVSSLNNVDLVKHNPLLLLLLLQLKFIIIFLHSRDINLLGGSTLNRSKFLVVLLHTLKAPRRFVEWDGRLLPKLLVDAVRETAKKSDADDERTESLQHEGDVLCQSVVVDEWPRHKGAFLLLNLSDQVELSLSRLWHQNFSFTSTSVDTLAKRWLVTTHWVEFVSIVQAGISAMCVACLSLLD